MDVVKRTGIYAAFLFIVGSCAPVVVATRPSPPADVVVVRPLSPAPGYVWVNDSWHYTRSGRSYRYQNGYWARPRKRGATWVDGAWLEKRGGWYYRKGHWH